PPGAQASHLTQRRSRRTGRKPPAPGRLEQATSPPRSERPPPLDSPPSRCSRQFRRPSRSGSHVSAWLVRTSSTHPSAAARRQGWGSTDESGRAPAPQASLPASRPEASPNGLATTRPCSRQLKPRLVGGAPAHELVAQQAEDHRIARSAFSHDVRGEHSFPLETYA